VTTLREWSSADDLELTAAQVETLANTDRFVLRPQPGASERWLLTSDELILVPSTACRPGDSKTPTRNGGTYRRIIGKRLWRELYWCTT
jgi:hypothetical protein